MKRKMANLICKLNADYNKVLVIDVNNFKLSIEDNDDNYDTGYILPLNQELENKEYTMRYAASSVSYVVQIEASIDITDEQALFDRNINRTVIISREKYKSINHPDRYAISETYVTFSVTQKLMCISMHLCEDFAHSYETEELMKNCEKAREEIPDVKTSEEIDTMIAGKDMTYRYTIFDGKSYLLDTDIYSRFYKAYRELVDKEIDNVIENKCKPFNRMNEKFYNKHKKNIEKAAKSKYNMDLNITMHNDINIVFDVSMFDVLSDSVCRTLSNMLCTSCRDDTKYAKFKIRKEHIDMIRKIGDKIKLDRIIEIV